MYMIDLQNQTAWEVLKYSCQTLSKGQCILMERKAGSPVDMGPVRGECTLVLQTGVIAVGSARVSNAGLQQ